MASPGELVKKISQVTGINEATVASTHRYLRDRGLITKGGRGTSSAKMTSLDAANLTIALLAAVAINDSPEVVERYGQLHVRQHGSICNLDGFWAQDEPKTFSACVRNIIEALCSGAIARAVSNIIGTEVETDDLYFRNTNITIGILRPEPEATVSLSALFAKGDDVTEVVIMDFVFQRSFLKGESRGAKISPAITKREMNAGLQERRWIDLSVVKAISEIL